MPSAANLVRGNEARIGGFRVGVIDKITPVREGGRHLRRRSSTSSWRRTSGRCRSTRRSSSARGRPWASSTSRSRGARRAGLRGRRADPALQLREAAADRHRRVLQHVRRADARRAARRTCAGYGAAFAGRGESINRAIEAFVPLAINATKVFRNITDVETRASSASSRSRETRRRSWRRWRRSRPRCSWPSTARSRPSPRSRDPYIQESITEGPERTRHRDRGVPEGDAVLRELGAVLHRAPARLPRAARLPQGPRRRVRDRRDRGAALGRAEQPA